MLFSHHACDALLACGVHTELLEPDTSTCPSPTVGRGLVRNVVLVQILQILICAVYIKPKNGERGNPKCAPASIYIDFSIEVVACTSVAEGNFSAALHERK